MTRSLLVYDAETKTGEMTREECEAIFNQLDKNHNGVISQEDFQAFLATQQGANLSKNRQSMAPPKAQTMKSAFTAAVPEEGVHPDFSGRVFGAYEGDYSEQVRSMRDATRAFAVAGPLLLFLMAFIPCWNCLALMRNETYLYFAGDG